MVAIIGQREKGVKLSAMDVLAPPTMKNAAKCDTSCDLQNPVNHQTFERILRFRDTPGSMLVGVSVHPTRPPVRGPLETPEMVTRARSGAADYEPAASFVS